MIEEMVTTAQNGSLEVKTTKQQTLLVEISYEVCNQLGGIYTVIRSKVPSMQEHWGNRYCTLGPYVHANVAAIFDPEDDYDNPYGRAVLKMREMGYQVQYGRWLTSGRPITVLLNPYQVYDKLGEIKYGLWEHHDIPTPGNDDLMNQVLAFGFLVKIFLNCLTDSSVNEQPVIAHVHEWMAGTAIPVMRRENSPVRFVFTTHATILGRYLAMNDGNFYNHLAFYDWLREARHFNIEAIARIERAAAHGSTIFTTVSEVTGRECEVLVGRKPDLILPNGLNIQRFAISHELQNVHQRFKDEIHQFVIGHFFPSYHFELDKTMYFFTSGRFEYRNKGYDLTLEALARLNWRMKLAKVDLTIVMFFITKQPFQTINPHVLNSQAQMTRIQQICEAVQKQIGDRLFYEIARNPEKKLPDLNNFVDDYWKLRLRRNLQSWKMSGLPPVVTHNLSDDANDPILKFLRTSNLVNLKDDKVKIIYHPDFINTTSPLLSLEYSDFVRGCHLGIFPSYYEPWGYTPLECIASGVPTVTSDLAGFGAYFQQNIGKLDRGGVYVVNRNNRSYEDAANQLADILFDFATGSRKDRIQQRYEVENAATHFDWRNLTKYYEMAYDMALQRKY